MPVSTPNGYLDFTNATPRATKIIATSNVGIGFNNPIYALDVAGTANVADIIINNDLTLTGGLTTNTLTINSMSMSTTSNFQQVTNLGNATTNTVQFTNPTTGFVTTGNVGIGTANPIRILDSRSGDGSSSAGWISGAFGPATGLSTNPRVVVGTYSNVAIVGSHRGDLNTWADLYLNIPSYPVVVNTSGNVGIGTTNPDAGKLDILVPDGGTGIHIRGGDYGSINGEAHIRIGGNGISADDISHHAMITGGHTSQGRSYLSFSTIKDYSTHTNSPVERMRIDNNGNVGIGKVNPTQKLDVNGSILANSYRNAPVAFRSYVITATSSGTASLMSMSDILTQTVVIPDEIDISTTTEIFITWNHFGEVIGPSYAENTMFDITVTPSGGSATRLGSTQVGDRGYGINTWADNYNGEEGSTPHVAVISGKYSYTGSTRTLTVKLVAMSTYSGSNTIYTNRTDADTNFVQCERGITTLACTFYK